MNSVLGVKCYNLVIVASYNKELNAFYLKGWFYDSKCNRFEFEGYAIFVGSYLVILGPC